MLARLRTVKSPMYRAASRAKTAKSTPSDEMPASPNVHAMLARSYMLKSPTRRTTTLASDEKKDKFHWQLVANAHEALVRLCVSKSSVCNISDACAAKLLSKGACE
eukprot:gnl/TRDRNA2_/TRDRNA2_142047_c3_seq3.p2 gnl/TRDRNA2_/TRDRNA2_142047_c3~~gnl/TRDRNA2_/TRDRNA2_142047_c3_seq3.p2  ORF type:complete len:106 (-),score=13.09 gnl/TRDRNA2_/TRDRNA2_142047_c3_seq3:140-457(-)